jgi:hypothetical protein
MRRIILVFFLANFVAFASVGVTSQEQFKRLNKSASPYNLNYNFERAYLQARASGNCPSHSKAFFFVHISKAGDVTTVRGHSVALSADRRGVELEWARSLLKRMRFRPLMYGTKPSSVDMALTLVCAE